MQKLKGNYESEKWGKKNGVHSVTGRPISTGWYRILWVVKKIRSIYTEDDLSFFLFLNSNKTARGEPREYTSSGGTKASVN